MHIYIYIYIYIYGRPPQELPFDPKTTKTYRKTPGIMRVAQNTVNRYVLETYQLESNKMIQSLSGLNF